MAAVHADLQPSSPKINEFTTDIEHPPPFRGGKDAPYPERFKEHVRAEYADLQPLVLKGTTQDEVFAKAAQAANEMTRCEITHEEDREGCIEGTYTTLFTRKKEDFTILITQGSKADEVVVNMRTRSRTAGAIDGNERITTFFERLQELMRDED